MTRRRRGHRRGGDGNTVRCFGRSYPILASIRLGAVLYQVVERLIEAPDRGVLKAVDTRHHRLCLLRWSTGSLNREYKVLRRVANHNLSVPHLDGKWTQDGRSYLVVSWVEGESLLEFLRDASSGNAARRFPVDDAWKMIRDLTQGLMRLHRERIVHGDIKPANLVVCKRRPLRLQLIDFGEAWMAEAATLRDPGRKTLGYCSPEQLTGNGLVDQRSDQFSICVVLHEMLGLELPYGRAGSNAATSRRPPGYRPPKYKPRWKLLDRVLERGLSFDPDGRYPSTDEFLLALREAEPPREKRRYSLREKDRQIAARLESLHRVIGWFGSIGRRFKRVKGDRK